MEAITDEISKRNLYELAINLPYVQNKREFDRQLQYLLTKLQAPQLDYFRKMETKKKYWAKCYNIDGSLGSHCKGLVECINRLHKNHVSLKYGLPEYLFRTIKFSEEFNNKNGISIASI